MDFKSTLKQQLVRLNAVFIVIFYLLLKIKQLPPAKSSNLSSKLCKNGETAKEKLAKILTLMYLILQVCNFVYIKKINQTRWTDKAFKIKNFTEAEILLGTPADRSHPEFLWNSEQK